MLVDITNSGICAEKWRHENNFGHMILQCWSSFTLSFTKKGMKHYHLGIVGSWALSRMIKESLVVVDVAIVEVDLISLCQKMRFMLSYLAS